jgi:hypothetical protein
MARAAVEKNADEFEIGRARDGVDMEPLCLRNLLALKMRRKGNNSKVLLSDRAHEAWQA